MCDRPERHPGEPRIGVRGRPRGPGSYAKDWIPAFAGMTEKESELGGSGLIQQHWGEGVPTGKPIFNASHYRQRFLPIRPVREQTRVGAPVRKGRPR